MDDASADELEEHGAVPTDHAVGKDPLLGWAAKRPVQTWAAFVFVAFVLKVTLETRGNREVALGVLQSSGAANVVLSLVASFLPYLLFAGGLYLATLAFASPRAYVTSVAAGVAVLASMLVMPAWIAAVLLLIILAVLSARMVQRRWRRRLGASSGWRSDWREVVLAAQVVAIALYVVAPGMWLPPERIALVNGQSEVGYVVEVNSEWTTALREGDRLLLRVRSESVAMREVCRLRPLPSLTLPQLLLGGGPSPIPDC